MKRILSLVLVLMMAIACVSMADAEDTAAVGTALFPCDENGYPDLGGVTIDIWTTTDSSMVDFITTYADLKVIQNIEELFNVNITFRQAPVGEEADNFATMLASQDLPDIIWSNGITDHYKGGVSMAYEDGVIYDYTEYINEEDTPHYWAKVMSDPYYAKLAVDDYGRNVKLGSRVSGSVESCTCMWGMMIRSDYLAEAGLDVPETIDDWTEMLRAFKEMGIKYPLLLNKSAYYAKRNAFSAAWNVDARNFYITEDGTVEYGPASEGYKEYMKTLAMWYSEGLINPDFMTDTQSDTWSMIANGDAGAVVDHTYNYAADYYQVVEKDDPSVALVAANLPKLNDDDELTHVMVTNRNIDCDKYICADSEVKEECIALLDALYIDEIEFMLSNGIEGIGYNLNDAGYPVITDVESNPDATVEEKRCMRLYEWETESDSDINYIMTSKYCYGVQPECIKLLTQCSYDRLFPAVSYTTEEAEINAKYKTDIETYRDEMAAKFITGEADVEATWDEYINTLNEMGLQEWTEVAAAAYERFSAR